MGAGDPAAEAVGLTKSPGLYARLSFLMFLQWAIPGALVPLYSTHLTRLGFSEIEIGRCAATQAVASVVASLVAGQVADRWFSAERALALCSLLAGVDLWVLASLTRPWEVFAATLFFWMMVGPMVLLGTTVGFTHLANPEKQFGGVRLWGTVGWMAVSWMTGLWLLGPGWLRPLLAVVRPEAPEPLLSDAFRIGTLLAFTLAAFSLTLPPTPPRKPASIASRFAPLAALALLGDPAFVVYFACMLVSCITFPLTTQLTPLLFGRLGVGDSWLGRTLSLAQVTEIACLWMMPWLLRYFAVRGTMIVGLAAWLGVFSLLSLGQPLWLMIASLVFNGFYVACFLVAGQLYVNSRTRGDLRASAQALFNGVNGLGMLVGNEGVGWLRRATGDDLPTAFRYGAALIAILFLTFLIGFRPAIPSTLPVSESDGLEPESKP